MPSPSVSYKRHRFPPAIIAHAVWLYFRFPLSLRLVEEMLLERGLAGGFPLSGVIGRAAIMDAADPGGLGGTYAGNPLACVAALAVLDIFEEEKLLERSNAIGARLKARLESILTSNSTLPIAAIRGPGAMVAFDIIKERGGDEPDAIAPKRVVQRACELGLILLSCGVNANTIRILAPLTASDELIDEGLDLLEAALKA